MDENLSIYLGNVAERVKSDIRSLHTNKTIFEYAYLTDFLNPYFDYLDLSDALSLLSLSIKSGHQTPKFLDYNGGDEKISEIIIEGVRDHMSYLTAQYLLKDSEFLQLFRDATEKLASRINVQKTSDSLMQIYNDNPGLFKKINNDGIFGKAQVDELKNGICSHQTITLVFRLIYQYGVRPEDLGVLDTGDLVFLKNTFSKASVSEECGWYDVKGFADRLIEQQHPKL